MTTQRTPLADQDKKIDLIEHINNDHPDEVLSIAQIYCSPQASTAYIEDVFEEGCLIKITANGQTESTWLPFVLEGDLEEKVLYLAYDAMVRQGKSLSGRKKQYFNVVGKEYPSANMLRLVLKSQSPLPLDTPGYAWMFSLKALTQVPVKIVKPVTKTSFVNQWFNRLFLWWLRRISPRRREKMLRAMSKGLRYYTLRKARKSTPELTHADLAEVDVFVHGDTPGGLWAQQLQVGDIVHSTSEYHEHLEHIHQGNIVLIADETSLPTVAALLENWHNPTAPVVIVITTDKADQHYLPDTLLPQGGMVHRLVNPDNPAQDVIAILSGCNVIDAAWGALENNEAKTIRKYLRDIRQLNGKLNRVKGYWKQTSGNLDQS